MEWTTVPMELGGRGAMLWALGASMGIADVADPVSDPVTADELLRQADQAMYTAKRGGTGRAARAGGCWSAVSCAITERAG